MECFSRLSSPERRSGVARRTDERLLLAAGLFLCLPRRRRRAGCSGSSPRRFWSARSSSGRLTFSRSPPARARLADGLIGGAHARDHNLDSDDDPSALATNVQRRCFVRLLQRYAAGDNRPHGIFCSVIAWCDYAVVLPTLRPLMDERVERSNPSTRKAQHDVARVAKGWERTLASQHIDTVLTHRSDALAALPRTLSRTGASVGRAGRCDPLRARSAMKYAWLIVAVFSARFLVSAIAYPQVDGDLSWQRWLGAQILRTGSIPRAFGTETFTAPGVPWLPKSGCSRSSQRSLRAAGVILFSEASRSVRSAL